MSTSLYPASTVSEPRNQPYDWLVDAQAARAPAPSPRPWTLNALVVAEILAVALQILWVTPTPPADLQSARTSMGLEALVWAAIIYPLWRGSDWARIIMIIGAGLALPLGFGRPHETTEDKIILGLTTFMALAWLICLNSRSVIDFTNKRPAKPLEYPAALSDMMGGRQIVRTPPI